MMTVLCSPASAKHPSWARGLWLLLLLILVSPPADAAPPSTNSVVANRVLNIEPSSMPVAGGRATLTIGTLLRTEGVYTGAYRINVSPYFYKNEIGKLNIIVSDESLAKLSRGAGTDIKGSATSGGKGGATRRIAATATPANSERGTLKLWFMSGDRKMTFEPAYRFAQTQTAAIFDPTNINPNLKRRLPLSHRETGDAETQRR